MEVKDWLTSDLSVNIYENKYRHNDETLDEFLERVSNGDKEVQQLILEKRFTYGGRILANRGLQKEGRKITYSNCYVLAPPEDNIESIYETCGKLARTFSASGGVGIDISKLRPKGAPVNNAAKTTSGAVSFMSTFSQVAEVIGMNGRRAAEMISMDVSHPDIEDFIDIKTDLNAVTKANISVRINENFINAVKNKEKYACKFTLEDGSTIIKYVDADKLMDKIAKNNHSMGEPGVLYWDKIQNYNLMQHFEDFEYAGVNPCFTGNMKLLTKDGYKTFEELCDTYPLIINKDGQESNSHIWCSGEKETIKLIMSNNKIITCTPNHVFLTQDNNEIEASELKGKKIQLNTLPIRTFDPEYIKYGFIQGDGELTSLDKLKYIVINVGQKDYEILNLFDNYEWLTNNREIKVNGLNDKLNNLGFSHKTLSERDFPELFESFSLDEKASFLQGCYTANGCVIKNHRVSYKTTSAAFALHLKEYLLSYFDIDSNITVNKPKVVHFDNGDYLCAESYDVCINKIDDIVKFSENIGFYYSYKKQALVDLINYKTPYVRNIKPNGVQKVYDFTEPIVHWGIVEGRIAHNCAEESLPAGGSCLLGSINLSEFILDPFTRNAKFDYNTFAKVVKKAVFALNDVLIEGLPLHPLKEQRESVAKYKQIGLGIMGLADALIKLGITYGSPESLSIIEIIGTVLLYNALIASNEYTKIEGNTPFDNYNADKILNSDIVQNLIKNLNYYEVIKLKAAIQDGLFNSQLLTIPPSGSIANLFNTSFGMEPNFAFKYTRKTESLHDENVYYTVEPKIVEDYRKATGNKGELPDYFITTHQLDPFNRVDVQATIQKYIDASISSTVNLPESATVEEVKAIYLYGAEKGVKGLTVFRNNCERMGILTVDDNKEKEEGLTPVEKAKSLLNFGDTILVDDSVIGIKRKLKTGCGSLHCTFYFCPETGELREVFLDKGSSGGCLSLLNAMSRLASLCARKGAPVEEIADQLQSVLVCPSYAVAKYKDKSTSKGSSCASAVAIALLDAHEQFKEEFIDFDDDTEIEIKTVKKTAPVKAKITSVKKSEDNEEDYYMTCPECGEKALLKTEGCVSCMKCGWSRCG